jgi:hypothetical protein
MRHPSSSRAHRFSLALVVGLLVSGFITPVFMHAASASGSMSRDPGLVWLEAETFKNVGGWTKDWQFIDQMGSPYLMSIGYGSPVADATTTVERLPAGKYRLWVRAKDWMPQHHPGRFEIRFNGRSAAKVFGASGQEGWIWEDGGVHDLEGDVAVSLHDLQDTMDAATWSCWRGT